MKKSSLWIITALMTLALVGVFVMQLYYIRESYNLNSKLFEQNINQALTVVVNKVQRQNAADNINKKTIDVALKHKDTELERAQKYVDLRERFKKEEEQRKLANYKQIVDELNYQDTLVKMNFGNAIIISEEEYQNLGNLSLSGVSVITNDVRYRNGNVVRTAALQYDSRRAKTFSLNPSTLPDSVYYLVQDPRDGRPLGVSVPTVDSKMAKKFTIEEAIANRRFQQELNLLNADTANLLDDNSITIFKAAAKEMADKNVPLSERIPSRDKLDTLIKKELFNKGITIAYDFWVKLANKDSVLYQNVSKNETEILPKNVYQFTLFNKDIIRDPGMLYVYFPDKNNLIMENMFVSMASSVGLLLVLIFIFAYTLFAIIRQKNLSEM